MNKGLGVFGRNLEILAIVPDMILAVLVTKETVRMTKKNRFCFLCYHTLIITNQSNVLTFLRSIEIRRQKNLLFPIMDVGMEKLFAILPRGYLEIAMMLRENNLITFD